MVSGFIPANHFFILSLAAHRKIFLSWCMSFLNELNPVQRDAARTLNGPVMIVAGAGSGKTRLLTYRIANLISAGVPPYQILALTFTNKAAREMKERIMKLVGEAKGRSIWMGTFHSLFARVLRVEAEKIGYGRNFSIYDSADSLNLIKHIMEAAGIPTQQFNPQAIRSRISGAKNQLIMPDEYFRLASDQFEEKTATVYQQYQLQLKNHNALDFDDLLLKPIELFHSHKKTLEQYQDKWRFIHVDEYQDTNHAQYTLVKTLATRFRNICVVGDDAQSIYAFRGADIRNILNFERDFSDSKVFRLEQNYRSTKTILSAADRVIKHNANQIEKHLWTENQQGEPITVLECEDDKDEGNQIVHHIFSNARHLGIDLRHVAVLYRTNAQSRSIEDALRKNAVSYSIVGGVEFYQRKEIKDVLAYLKVLANPKDNESFLRIVNYPVRGLGEAALSRLRAFADTESTSLREASRRFMEIEGLSQRAREGLRSVAGLLDKYDGLRAMMSLTEWTRAMVDELGILTAFKDEGTVESMARWENVQELLSAISEKLSEMPELSLESFLEEVALVSDLDQWEDRNNAVTLMTLHSAKGLEFPLVFITGMEEGLLPFFSTAIEPKDLEEERRLYYVGITRAMKKLYLTYTRVRFRFGEVTHPLPSRFLSEIGTDCIELSSSRRRHPSYADSGKSPGLQRASAQSRPRRGINEFDQQEYGEEMNQEVPDLRVGGYVEHEHFGKGKIVGLSGSGESSKAVIDFPVAGRKNLLLRYAKLKLL